jgi:hypothetical protein
MVIPFYKLVIKLAYKEEQILRADLNVEYSKQVKIFGRLLVLNQYKKKGLSGF